jgi:hypothetical protein
MISSMDRFVGAKVIRSPVDVMRIFTPLSKVSGRTSIEA